MVWWYNSPLFSPANTKLLAIQPDHNNTQQSSLLFPNDFETMQTVNPSCRNSTSQTARVPQDITLLGAMSQHYRARFETASSTRASSAHSVLAASTLNTSISSRAIIHDILNKALAEVDDNVFIEDDFTEDGSMDYVLRQ